MAAVLDHLVVTAPDLARGVAHVAAALGVAMVPGGKHPVMGTHNCLLRIGDGQYLEVIAVDPGAPLPARPRWFGLDAVPVRAALAHWVLRSDALEADIARCGDAPGAPLALSRGDLAWRMALRGDGRLSQGGLAPSLMQWDSGAHPAGRLPDCGLRLVRLVVSAPDPAALVAARPQVTGLDRVEIRRGPAGLMAEIAGPGGMCWLT